MVMTRRLFWRRFRPWSGRNPRTERTGGLVRNSSPLMPKSSCRSPAASHRHQVTIMRWPIILDYDGTLIESRRDQTDHLLKALNNFGCPGRPEEVPRAWGKPFREFLRIIAPATEHRFDAFVRFYGDQVAKSPPIPSVGITDAIPALMALGPLFVHSSSYSLLVRRELAALGIAGSFEFICGSDWQSLPKPDPQSLTPILDLLRHGGYAPEHCTYVGDAPERSRLGRGMSYRLRGRRLHRGRRRCTAISHKTANGCGHVHGRFGRHIAPSHSLAAADRMLTITPENRRLHHVGGSAFGYTH